MPARKRPLTKFELYALEAYAARHGRRWKRHLLADWVCPSAHRRRATGPAQFPRAELARALQFQALRRAISKKVTATAE